MYVSHIGKKYLQYYNKKHNTSYSAKKYFIEVHWPLFYDDVYYLHSPGNTPFFQLVAQHKTGDSEERKKALKVFNDKIVDYIKQKDGLPNMSYAISYPAADILGTTSGQVSTIELNVSEDEIYASWIGAGVTIGIGGGMNVLVDNETIFEYLEEGFTIYREYIKETPEIRNKIETWNGLWLAHRVKQSYKKETHLLNFVPVRLNNKNEASMERITWVQMYFILAQIMQDEMAQTYISALGQTNKTIGFIQFKLFDVTRLSDLYEELYIQHEFLSNKELSQIYESQLGLYTACQAGVIGLKQLEPKKFREFMQPTKAGNYPTVKDDEKSQINYFIYKLWIIAMLNNKELQELAKEAAQEFKAFINAEKRTSTKRTNLINAILEAKSKKDFIDKINEVLGDKDYHNKIINGTEQNKPLAYTFEKLVNAAILDIAIDNLPLFISLLKFEYLIKN